MAIDILDATFLIITNAASLLAATMVIVLVAPEIIGLARLKRDERIVKVTGTMIKSWFGQLTYAIYFFGAAMLLSVANMVFQNIDVLVFATGILVVGTAILMYSGIKLSRFIIDLVYKQLFD
jgi:hypothetical protein